MRNSSIERPISQFDSLSSRDFIFSQALLNEGQGANSRTLHLPTTTGSLGLEMVLSKRDWEHVIWRTHSLKDGEMKKVVCRGVMSHPGTDWWSPPLLRLEMGRFTGYSLTVRVECMVSFSCHSTIGGCRCQVPWFAETVKECWYFLREWC